MATVQAVLRKKKNSSGQFPIAVRITKDGQSVYKYTGQYVLEKHWDEKNRKIKRSHPNSSLLNNLLIQKIAEANAKLIESESKEEYEPVSLIKKKIDKDKNLNFFDVATMHLDNLKGREKFHQYKTELGRINKFKDYVGKSYLHFNEITPNLLIKFQSYITIDLKRSPRTSMNYLILIRTIYNLAITEGIIDRSQYPFGKGKVQIKRFESHKIGLNEGEIKLLEKGKDLTNAQQLAIHVWLLSFYFAGIRVSDVLKLKWSDFKDNRLYYRMGKNKKLVSLKIPDKAKPILRRYKKMKAGEDDFVFPHLKGFDMENTEKLISRIQGITRNINRRLKDAGKTLGIAKPLSMHIARHSFGNISGDKIPIQMLQKLYRHSSVTTTINYQANFMQKEADDALDSVIDF